MLYFLRDYCLAPLRKARRRRLARDGGVLQMQIEPGVKLTLPGNDGVAGLIYAYHYEVGEREFVRRYLQIGDTFVDVGAHIGLFTLIAAHKVGPAGKVIAFEPCKTSFEVLKANIALNELSNVKCENMALSNRQGFPSRSHEVPSAGSHWISYTSVVVRGGGDDVEIYQEACKKDLPLFSLLDCKG